MMNHRQTPKVEVLAKIRIVAAKIARVVKAVRVERLAVMPAMVENHQKVEKAARPQTRL
jgi:hypothetical protein